MKLHEFIEMVEAQRAASKLEAMSALTATMSDTKERKTDNE